MGGLELLRGTEMIGIEEVLHQGEEEMISGVFHAGGTSGMMGGGGAAHLGDLQEEDPSEVEVVTIIMIIMEGLMDKGLEEKTIKTGFLTTWTTYCRKMTPWQPELSLLGIWN